MKQRLSDDLINFASMLMLAHERGEIISLASELNKTICKAIEIENASTTIYPQENKKTISAEIKFTKKELDTMPKTFKKEFIANGCVAHITKRPSGKNNYCYEIRYRRNGYNISVSNCNLQTAKNLFVKATQQILSPEEYKRNNLTFKTIAYEWLEYKKGKVTDKTIQDNKSLIERKLPNALLNAKIKEIRTVDVDRVISEYSDKPRQYENIRGLINAIFKYAIASGVVTHNPVTLIPFKKAERTNREALTKEEVKEFLKRLKQPEFEPIRQVAYTLYFFGLRPCEIDNELRTENDFLICRNRKRKGGKIEYKKIPIPQQAREFIKFDKPIKFPLSYNRSTDFLKRALPNNKTPYNLRHTFASTCAEYVKPEVLDIWMGDSSERLVGKVYVHYKDNFMIDQMNEVHFITD